ncbi:hypothetical protein CHARACLAT_003674 [Characodon lateralis]|uniref:Uncharacterized protein n=1 Tax=Characodon lateralis TaxID=208331 RepID=A0ABU7DXM0_9TELE|nr:hypothetical protein [Characodon lateralis]
MHVMQCSYMLTHYAPDRQTGRQACQRCWRALGGLLLQLPFPPSKALSGSGGRGIRTVWTQARQAKVTQDRIFSNQVARNYQDLMYCLLYFKSGFLSSKQCILAEIFNNSSQFSFNMLLI